MLYGNKAEVSLMDYFLVWRVIDVQSDIELLDHRSLNQYPHLCTRWPSTSINTEVLFNSLANMRIAGQ